MGLVIGGGTALIGGLMGSSAAKSASSQQANALNQALDFQKGIYNNSQTNLSPFIGAGTNALSALQSLYGLGPGGPGDAATGSAAQGFKNFQSTPFYQFPLQQGIDSLNASGAARGLTLSGGQLNALQKYGSGYASSNFGNYISALSNLANLGESSAGALAGVGNQAAGTNLTGSNQLGTALASGTIGSQNQINNALGAIPGLLGIGNGSSYGGGSNSNGGGNGGGWLGNALSGLFNSPSAAGSPNALQQSMGLSADQFVP